MQIRKVMSMAVVLTLFLTMPIASAPQGARLELDLGPLAARAKETANITIDKNTMNWALQALNSKGEAEKLQEMMQEIEGIYVQVMEFDKAGAPAWEELVEATRTVIQELDGPQWAPIISVTGKKGSDPQLVRISRFEGSAGETGGLAVFVIEPTEVVLVNLVGSVRLDHLGILGKLLGKPGMFNPQAGQTSPQEQQKESE